MIEWIQVKLGWRNFFRRQPKRIEHVQIVLNRLTGPLIVACLFATGPILFLVWPITIGGLDQSDSEVLKILQDWQTLISCSFILLGATFTVRAVVIQIASAEEAEQNRLQIAADLDQRNTAQKLLAARSTMPLVLSNLNQYAKEVACVSDAVLSVSPENRVQFPSESLPPLPLLPHDAIKDLKGFIKVAPEDLGERVADILSDLQIISVRAQNTWERTSIGGGEIVTRSNYTDLIVRAAIMSGRASSLFSYMRRETNLADPLTVEGSLNPLRSWFGPLTDRSPYRLETIREAEKQFKLARETAPPQSPATD